jgi:regulator of cell morphogenesis and NO signaling
MNENIPADVLPARWRHASVAELVSHIVEVYHNGHRTQLPELVQLSRKVERVHAGHPACPSGLADALEQLYQELESHMLKEEQVLFPMLANGMGAQARGPIGVMRFEHDEQAGALKALEHITAAGLPQDACGSWRNLYAALNAFRTDLEQHIRLENEVLFTNHSQVAQGAHHA